MMSRIIIAGGRDFNDYELLKDYMNGLLNVTDTPLDEITIISGHANGADKLGEQYAKELGLKLEVYPADWEKNGKKAGFIRNGEMMKVADGLVAFWDGQSAGTMDMIERMNSAGKEVHIQLYHK